MISPPKILLWLLDRFCPPSRQDLKGDFLELYKHRKEEKGRSKANLRFFWDTITVLPLRFFIKNNRSPQSTMPMFSHYLKIAFRSLSRSKAYSLINILGLAVGMGVCLLIYQYISFELSYDRFHANADHLYRVTQAELRDEETLVRSSYTTFGLGPAIKQEVPDVQQMTRVHRQYEGLIMINRERNIQHQEDEMWYVDSSFLEVFSFPLKYGDKRTALADQSSIVITAEMATRYFGDEDPMGKVLRVSGGTLSGDFLVTGVLEPLPVNTHLQFDFLLPVDFLLTHWRLYTEGDGWDWKNFVTYVTIAPSADISKVAQKLDLVVDSHVGEYLSQSGVRWNMGLQLIDDIHLHSDFERDIAKNNGEIETLYYFTIIGILVMLMAWVNFVNLSTAKTINRAKEVGIRKSIGAQRGQLIWQFLIESILINGLAALLSFGVVLLLLPTLNELVGKHIPFDLISDINFWIVFAALFLVGSLLSGSYPAIIVSSFKPTGIFKPTPSLQVGQKGSQKGLTVFQFLASLLLISGTGLVYSQINFMKNHDLGMDIETMVVINGPRVILETLKEEGETLGSKYKTFRDLAKKHHTISAISATSNIPGRGFLWSGDMRKDGEPGELSKTGSVVFVDTTFFDLYGFEFVAGGIPEGETGEYQWVIVNEAAVSEFGLGSADEALNFKLQTEIADPLKIAGVVRNPHWGSLKTSVTPIAFFLDNQYGAFLSAKVGVSNMQESLSHLEASYHTAFPNDPFEYFFLDDSFNRQYQADQQFGNLFTAFSVLAIFISCLGLFALVSFSAGLKTKEIGIRKVLGASVSQLMALLSKEYLVLLLIASLLAVPLVIWGGQQWLENYAFRIKMGVEFIVVPVVVLLIISLLTVSYKTWAAARANPVNSLRTE